MCSKISSFLFKLDVLRECRLELLQNRCSCGEERWRPQKPGTHWQQSRPYRQQSWTYTATVDFVADLLPVSATVDFVADLLPVSATVDCQQSQPCWIHLCLQCVNVNVNLYSASSQKAPLMCTGLNCRFTELCVLCIETSLRSNCMCMCVSGRSVNGGLVMYCHYARTYSSRSSGCQNINFCSEYVDFALCRHVVHWGMMLSVS